MSLNVCDFMKNKNLFGNYTAVNASIFDEILGHTKMPYNREVACMMLYKKFQTDFIPHKKKW
jgi:hypothetical protein